MENLKITEDLSSIFPIEKIFIKREEIQNFYSKNHGHSHDNNQHGHSHNGKPCDGHSHNQNQNQKHAHSHNNNKPPKYTQSHTEEDDEECIDDEEHHGHSHNQKNHGHSHNQQVSHKGHSHSHNEEEEDEECNDDDEHHGHSHNQKNHGHSHDHNQHGHSHEKKQPQQHGHSHDHNQHGHSHENKQPQQHGHSHNGKPCDGNHKAPILFNLINLSTSAFLGISKLKLYLSNEKKKTTFEGWWKEQKQNNNAKQLIEERVESILESSNKGGEIEKTDMIQIAPELFDIPSLLGEKKDEKIEDSKSYNGDLLALINYFIKFNDDCRLNSDVQGAALSEDFFRIVCFCALIIPLIEKATGESLSPNKTVKKNFNSKCEKHQEKYLVHPYTSEWICFQCHPSVEDLKVINYLSNIQNQLRQSIAQVSGVESLCSDTQCKNCPYYVNLGFHEKRGMLRYLSNNYEIVCGGCGKLTGKQKSGLLLVEINQRHTVECKDKRYQEKVPSANCGCLVHTSFYLICSLKCHKKLKLPEYEQTKTLYSQASQKIVVYSSGPLVLGCFHYNEKGQLIEFEITPNKNVLETACNVCGKSDSKSCGRCKSTFYCSVECQKKDWPNHKLICKQN